MNITVKLHYIRVETDGAEKTLPCPINYPDTVKFQVPSMDHFMAHAEMDVAAAVQADVEVHSSPPLPKGVEIRYSVVETPDPNRN